MERSLDPSDHKKGGEGKELTGVDRQYEELAGPATMTSRAGMA